jgi:UDP-glucose:(heptosyl)LPS alpha-1,3-glucosyltransferase
VKDQLHLTRNLVVAWPQIIHRRLYYRLIEALERHVYRRRDLPLAVISHKVASDLGKYYGRADGMAVVYSGLDIERFSPERRSRLRDEARSALGFRNDDFVLLLVGNDWKNKGLSCLLEAVIKTENPHLRVVVAGRDNLAPFAPVIARGKLEGRVSFAPPRPDVEFYYAAADAYVGPSLEDAFAQPPAEAMACGLPAITTRMAGVSEIIHHGVDALILEDPTDAETLSGWIKRLSTDPAWCKQLGEAAARTARQYTWERNAEQMRDLFEQARRSRAAP